MQKINSDSLWDSFSKYTERVSDSIGKISLSIIGLCFLFSGATPSDFSCKLISNTNCFWAVACSILSVCVDLFQNIYGVFLYQIWAYRCEDGKCGELTTRGWHLPITVLFLLKIICCALAAYFSFQYMM